MDRAKTLRAIFGAKEYSVTEIGNNICQKLGIDSIGFTPPYNGTGIKSTNTKGLRISIVRNRVNAIPDYRYPNWEETKFKNYPVLIHVFVDSDKLEFPPSKWPDIEKTITSFEGVYCLYLQDH